MSYEYLGNEVQIKNDVIVRCNNCGCDNTIEVNQIYSDECYGNGSMGRRTEYDFSAECYCHNCLNVMTYHQRVSEYPAGSIEYVNRPTCDGGEVLSKQKFDFDLGDDGIWISNRFSPRTSYRKKNIRLEGSLQVDICDGDGYIGDQIDFDKKIWINPAGRLLPLLVDETGSIRFDENKAVLCEILVEDTNSHTMRLLGKIAEAVIVRNCDENSEQNRIWLAKARMMRTSKAVANCFKALGTGLNSTRRKYPKKYNFSDPQRDVIWINKDEECAIMKSKKYGAANIAGLQVKLSGNGLNYLKKALLESKYEVPIVYFPINDDYDKIVANLEEYCSIDDIAPGEKFIDVRDVDSDAFEEIMDYYSILYSLLSGKVTVDQFVREASNRVPIRNGIVASALSTNQTEVWIIR